MTENYFIQISTSRVTPQTHLTFDPTNLRRIKDWTSLRYSPCKVTQTITVILNQASTVVPTKSDSDVVFCLQLLSKQ